MEWILINSLKVSFSDSLDLIDSNKAKSAGKGLFIERIQGQIHLEGQEGLVQNLFANSAEVNLRVEKGTPTSDAMELLIFGRNLAEFP